MLLIIDNKPRRGAALAELFHFMGVLAFTKRPIASLGDVSPHLSALLLVEPDELPDTKDFIDRIKRLCRTLPIFALSKGEIRCAEDFCEVFHTERCDYSVLLRMRERCEAMRSRPVGDYALAGMDASFYENGVRLKGEFIPLTRTERMILRYLFCVYPSRVSTAEIVRFAFRPERTPDPACVRAHVCAINKKVSGVLGRPLIDSVRTEGYRVITPEVLEDRKHGIFN